MTKSSGFLFESLSKTPKKLGAEKTPLRSYKPKTHLKETR